MSHNTPKICSAAAAVIGFALLAAAPATATLNIGPITWNVIGLDSNSPISGPKDFPVGVRVCSNVATTNVSVVWSWDSANANINLRPGSLSIVTIPSIGAGACADAYFEAEVTQVAAAYDTTRRYHVTATDLSGSASTPTPRELYVEHLVSQNRNGINGVKLDGVSIPAGGTMNLLVGNTYSIELDGFTATQGYNQFEEFISFPNTIFQVLAVSTTYTADTNTTNVPNPNPSLYANACIWDSNPASPTYRSCIGGDDKAGGTVVTTYTVKIISGGGTAQTLNTLLYDFSGSSYHYNADFSTGARIASIVDPATALTFAKLFGPNPVAAGGVSTLTFTITNPTATSIGSLNFTDTFPTSPGAMVVAGTPAATTSGCGSPTFSPAAGAASISFSAGTIAANGTCTIGVNVTAPTAGTYQNASADLFAGATDTTKTASSTLTMGSATKAPCVPGHQAALWTLEPPVAAGAVAANANVAVATTSQVATATASAPNATAILATGASGNGTQAWSNTAAWPTGNVCPAVGSAISYFEFRLDTSQYTGGAVSVSFDWDLETSGDWASNPNSICVYSSRDGGATFSTPTTITGSKAVWNVGATAATAGSVGSSTWFRISAAGRNGAKATSEFRIDNVTFTGCADNLAPPSAPTITKAFAPTIVAVNGTSTLTFTLTNPNAGTALSGISFADTLPSGLTVATSGPTATCGGSLTTTAPGTISLSGGALAASGTCNVAVAGVTANTSGAHDNVSDFISAAESGTNTGSSGFATATLTAVVPPVITKSFSPTSILAGIGVSAMAFQISNPNPGTALTGVAFNDNFPSVPGTMTVASPATFSTSGCGSPVFTPVAGATSIAFSGGTIAAGGTCTVTVNVAASAAGTYSNTTTAVSATTAGTGAVSNTAQLVVNTVNPSLDLRKEVSTSAAGPWTKFVTQVLGSPVFYRFSIYDSGDVTLTNLAVADPTLAGSPVDPAACTWPASLAPGDTATCIAGSPTSIPAASGSQTNTATASGSYLGTPHSSSPNSASYLGAAAGFSLLKQISTSATGPWASSITGVTPGSNLFYKLTIVNTGGVDLTSVNVTDATVDASACAFTDPLAVGGVTVCVVGPIAASAVPVVHTNSATAHGTTPTATVIDTPPSSASYSIFVIPPTISKSFAAANVALGGTVDMSFQLSNPGATALTGVSFSDTLPAGLTAPNGTTSPCGGSLAITGGNLLTFTGGSLAAGASCTITVTATGATAGVKNNTTGAVSSTESGAGSASNTATVTVTAPGAPTIAKSFASPNVAMAGSVNMSFVLANPGGSGLTGLAFTDTLPAGLTVPNGTTATCGGSLVITGNNLLTFTGGSLGAGANCTITVSVTGATVGVKNNTTGAISSNETGVGAASNTATVTVVAPPTIAKSFGAASIALNGTTSLDLTLTNPNATVALTGLAFTDTLPSGLTAPDGTTSPCGGSLVITGGNLLNFVGGTLAGGGSCTITVTVTGSSAGAQDNTTSAVTASGPVSLTGTGSNAATLTVAATATAGIPVLGPWTTLLFALLLGGIGARLMNR